MTRESVIDMLSRDMTESADIDTVVSFYYESMQKWLDSLDDSELVSEYDEWFSPDAPIEITEATND